MFKINENKTLIDYEDTKTSELKNILGSEIVESFSFRTCVNPKLVKKDSGETNIVYQSLTAKDLLQRFSTRCLQYGL